MLKDEPGAVHRLVDMVVEEVSLVDRAANQRRFLVVKRDESMSEPSTPDSTPPMGDVETSAAASGADDAPTDGPLGVAFAALQSLTDAVEMIGGAGEDQSTDRLASLAAELRNVAQQLDQAAGGESSDQEDESEEAETATVGQTIAEVRTILASIQAMVANAASATPVTPEAKMETSAPRAAPVTKAQAPSELGNVVSLLRTLTDAVSVNNKRLAKLEKSFGLPNSNTFPEGPARGREGKDVGWPLDMNKPMDRESVDKATSFHS